MNRGGERAVEEALLAAQRLTDDAASVLGAGELVAAILHGSLATGDFIPGRSDVDLLLVVEHELSDVQIAAILDVARHPTVTWLDLQIVTRAVAASPTASSPMELYVGRHDDEPDEAETRVSAEPDLVVELRAARAHGRSLAGQDPRDVIGPIPDEWITRYGYQILERWQELADDDRHAELMVLTACRIWAFAATGSIASKASAARWAFERAPSLSAIPAALRRHTGETGVSVVRGQVGDVLVAAKRAVARVLADGSRSG